MTTPTMSKPRLPQNLKWSDTWRPSMGADLVEGDRELPVDAATRVVAGWLMLCPIQPKDGEHPCRSEEWFFEKPKPKKYCPIHGQLLIEVKVDGASGDPVDTARGKLWTAAREALARRSDKAITAATERAAELRAAVALAGNQMSLDMAKHKPSLIASGASLGAGLAAAAIDPLVAAAAGGVTATGGALAAYAATWWWLSRKAEKPVVGRAAKKIRERGRHIALGTAVFGGWLTGAAALGVNVSTVGSSCTAAFVTLSGCALTWAVNRSHWETLWEDRRRLAELARMHAEAAARAAEEEAERLRRWHERQQAEVEETLEVIGQRMAAKWQEIAQSSTVPPGFLMSRTHIVPDRTREVMAPIDGVSTRIGYEYTIQAEPGALVARIGMGQPPIISVREWLAAMLERDPVTVATVDRPDGTPNMALLIVTDGAPLGGVVKWKGLDGIRRTADGAIFAHRGRSIQGEDVEEALYVPGQAGGGMVIGTTGGGKSASNILAILNRLAAGIFPTLFDPKQLVDYGDFVGIFPIGVTDEHRDVILNALVQERRRRERLVASKPVVDRHNRRRAGESVWRETDGPPIWHCWEEFHDLVRDEQFVSRLTSHVRFQRVAAMSATLLSQGGGLEDIGKSTLRGLLNQQELTTFRVDDHQARLAGRRDAGFNASDLPRLPGMCLILSPTAPPMPMRSAYVHREDRDGSVFDQLYAPDMTPLMRAPELPQATLDVFESEGLMDLWRLAQGPSGMERLLSEAPTMYAGPVDATVPVIGRMGAADVLLAIVVGNPGCDRKYIDSHVLWRTAPGWGKTPAPSTISRNASDLQKAGLLSRSDRNDGTDYRVTEKGLLRARSAADALSDKPRKAPQTEAEIEAAAERAAELAEEREK